MRRSMQLVAALWSGRIGLAEAFWWYGIVLGVLVNLTATFAALALLAAEGPEALALFLFLAPLPYDLLILVGVWRSAGQWTLAHEGEAPWAEAARIAIVVVVALYVFF